MNAIFSIALDASVRDRRVPSRMESLQYSLIASLIPSAALLGLLFAFRRRREPITLRGAGHWLALAVRHRGIALPCLANPGLATGGLWSESKAECLRAVAAAQRAAIADFVVIRRRADASTSLAGPLPGSVSSPQHGQANARRNEVAFVSAPVDPRGPGCSDRFHDVQKASALPRPDDVQRAFPEVAEGARGHAGMAGQRQLQRRAVVVQGQHPSEHMLRGDRVVSVGARGRHQVEAGQRQRREPAGAVWPRLGRVVAVPRLRGHVHQRDPGSGVGCRSAHTRRSG